MKTYRIIIAIIFIMAGRTSLAMDTEKPSTSCSEELMQQWIYELSKEEPDLAIIKRLTLQKLIDVNTIAWVETSAIFRGHTIQMTIKKYAILEAARKWDWDLVKILLDAGANPNKAMAFPHIHTGMTPLHYATAADNQDTATPVTLALIAAGADVHARDKQFNQSPIRQAIYIKNIPVIRAMLALGVKTNIKDYSGTTDKQAARVLGLDLDALRS